MASSLVAGTLFIGAPAEARDPLFSKPWTFKVRGNPVALNRAALVWQMKHAGAIGSKGGSSGAGIGEGGGGLMVPHTAANYSVVTVIMGDGAAGDIDIGTTQDSIGDQTAESNIVTSVGGNATLEHQP